MITLKQKHLAVKYGTPQEVERAVNAMYAMGLIRGAQAGFINACYAHSWETGKIKKAPHSFGFTPCEMKE